MDLIYNGQKVSQLPVTPQTTVGQIKETLKNWLVPQGVTNYTIRLFFNNNVPLSDVVFQTNTYDGTNFEAQKDLIGGGSIHITPVVSTVPAPSPKPATPVQTAPQVPKIETPKEKNREFVETETFYLVKYDDHKLFRTSGDAYEWLVTQLIDNGVDFEGIIDTDDVDYDDPNTQGLIDDYITENEDGVYVEEVNLLE